MNKTVYTPPILGVEEIEIEKGIAVSLSTLTVEQNMINEIWLTEEEVTW